MEQELRVRRGSTPPVRFLLVFAWVVGVGTAAQAPIREVVAAIAGWSGPGVVLWIGFAAFALQLAVQLRPLGNDSWASALFRVPLAAWFVIFFRSILVTARGMVRWKGRSVPVRPPTARPSSASPPRRVGAS